MEYKKVLIIILLSIMLTGCTKEKQVVNTAYYNLDITTSYEEKIDVYLTKDAYEIAEENRKAEESGIRIENELLYWDIKPIYSNHKEFYQKNIKKRPNDIKVELSYNYLEDEFIYSNNIMNCFENYDINSTKDSLTVKLSGEFYCLKSLDNLKIKVNSIFEVTETNGEKEDAAYVWNINSDNVNNTYITHTISRNYDGMLKNKDDISEEKKSNTNNNNWNIVRFIVSGIVLIILIIIYRNYKKNQLN